MTTPPADADKTGEGPKKWEEAANVVFGAYHLSLSSMGNPVHPRNLDYHKKFSEDPLRYAVELLDALQVADARAARMEEVLKKRAKKLNPSGVPGGYAVSDSEEYQEILEILSPTPSVPGE